MRKTFRLTVFLPTFTATLHDEIQSESFYCLAEALCDMIPSPVTTVPWFASVKQIFFQIIAYFSYLIVARLSRSKFWRLRLTDLEWRKMNSYAAVCKQKVELWKCTELKTGIGIPVTQILKHNVVSTVLWATQASSLSHLLNYST